MKQFVSHERFAGLIRHVYDRFDMSFDEWQASAGVALKLPGGLAL